MTDTCPHCIKSMPALRQLAGRLQQLYLASVNNTAWLQQQLSDVENEIALRERERMLAKPKKTKVIDGVEQGHHRMCRCLECMGRGRQNTA